MATQLPIGTVFARDFKVLRPLAQGGMGAVYVVEQLSTGRERALKIMHPRLVHDPKTRARFAQEARVGAWIQSEHVVDVLSAGIDDATGIPYIAMELLAGETLMTRVMRDARGKGLPQDEVRQILSELTRPLVAAHARGIVHRDLKPENVFLEQMVQRAGGFRVKLLDFGIVKRIDPNTPGSAATEAIGTPLWMAPEQNEAGEIGPGADVWAVGLLAYFALTGRFFWRAANERELVLAALLGEMVFQPLVAAGVRAREYGCDDRIPPGFDAWFVRCVARAPGDRFASAREMTEAMSQWLGNDSLATARARAPVALTAPSVGGSRPVPVTAPMAGEPRVPAGAQPMVHAAPTVPMASPRAGSLSPGVVAFAAPPAQPHALALGGAPAPPASRARSVWRWVLLGAVVGVVGVGVAACSGVLWLFADHDPPASQHAPLPPVESPGHGPSGGGGAGHAPVVRPSQLPPFVRPQLQPSVQPSMEPMHPPFGDSPKGDASAP
ncbi:MAG: protein kinase [Myxococcales bacterium]|nr:protein kinase [Myxococcales bacterium]